MKHLFAPYEIAALAKGKNFNEPCFAKFDKDRNNTFQLNAGPARGMGYHTSAPLYQQLVDWFRENKKIHITSIEDTGLYSFTVKWHNGVCYNEMPCRGGEYYEALNAALLEAFKLI